MWIQIYRYVYIYIHVCVCTCNSIMICLMWTTPLVVYVQVWADLPSAYLRCVRNYLHLICLSVMWHVYVCMSPGCLTETLWRKPRLLHALVVLDFCGFPSQDFRNMRQPPTKVRSGLKRRECEHFFISSYHHTFVSIHDLQWYSKCTHLRHIINLSLYIMATSIPWNLKPLKPIAPGALAQLSEPLLGHALSARSSCPIDPYTETRETVHFERRKGTKSPQITR